MHFYDKVSVVLMVQGTFDLFCYFNISPEAIYGFEGKYGVGSWNSSQPTLKVKRMENGNGIEIKSKEINKFDTSSFIKLEEDDIDVYVEYGRKLFGQEYISLGISNIVSTPRENNSKEESIYFIELEDKQVPMINTENINDKKCVNKSINKQVSTATTSVFQMDRKEKKLPSSININDTNISINDVNKYNFGIRYNISSSNILHNKVYKKSSFINVEKNIRLHSSLDNIGTNSYDFNKGQFEYKENIKFFKQHFYNINGKYKTSSSK